MSASASPIVTKTIHRAPYAAISPSRPELSQKERVVLITGSSGGIGFTIAQAFGKSGAAIVIMTGRREGPLTEAVAKLSIQFPDTKFIGHQVDVSNLDEVQRLWSKLDVENLVVDVLVLNAARVQHEECTLIELGHKEVWADYVTNVGSLYEFSNLFYHQQKRDKSKTLSLLNVSTAAIHNFVVLNKWPSYTTSKNAGTLLIQLVAQGVSANDMQVLSFHPGAIFTPGAQVGGFTRSNYDFDDDDLPGHYAVWAASEEARFLHGRFTWAAWDVDELKTGDVRKRIDEDPYYLKVGVIGI